jgi:PAB-dependent poly(A)-specific ribonuclease subunit 2
MLERVDGKSKLDYSALPMAVDPVILSEDISLSPCVCAVYTTAKWLIQCALRNRDRKLMKHEPLSVIELPRPGTVIAIDAEFVQMQQVQ